MVAQTGRLLDRRSRASGHRTAFVLAAEDRLLTWSDLAREARAWSELLQARHWQPADPIALIDADPLNFIGAYIGLLACGASVLPLDAGASARELQTRLTGFGIQAVATDSAHALAVARECDAAELWWADGQPRVEAARPRRSPMPALWHERATVTLSTSATTGLPEGVPLSEQNLLHAAATVAAHHGITARDRCYSTVPLVHVNAQVVAILACLVTGGSSVVDARFHRTDYWTQVERWQATWLNTVPAILTILADGPAPAEATARRLRFARSASAPLPVASLLQFQDRCRVSVLETYGMTEATGQITANPRDPRSRRVGSVGLPVGVELRVVDDTGQAAAPLVAGEVEIKGPSVITTALVPGDPPCRTKVPTHDGWLETGDIGYRDAQGFLYLTGRDDDVVNRGGEKVYPREIEALLLRHPAVTGAAVVGEPDPVLGEQPVAYVVADEGVPERILQAELQSLCASGLARPKRPAWICVTDALPTGPAGKVRRARPRDRAGLVSACE